MQSKFRLLLFCSVIIFCTGCDQITKAIAKQQLMPKGEVEYLHGVFKLIYVENTGAFYSLGENLTGVLGFVVICFLPLIIVAVVGGYAIINYSKLPIIELIALAMIFAGGIGNLFDRIYNHRHVIDFMYISVGPVHTGIFNFADLFLCCGVGLMVVQYFRVYRKKDLA